MKKRFLYGFLFGSLFGLVGAIVFSTAFTVYTRFDTGYEKLNKIQATDYAHMMFSELLVKKSLPMSDFSAPVITDNPDGWLFRFRRIGHPHEEVWVMIDEFGKKADISDHTGENSL